MCSGLRGKSQISCLKSQYHHPQHCDQGKTATLPCVFCCTCQQHTLRHFAAPLEEMPSIVAQGNVKHHIWGSFDNVRHQIWLGVILCVGDSVDWNQTSTSQQRDSLEARLVLQLVWFQGRDGVLDRSFSGVDGTHTHTGSRCQPHGPGWTGPEECLTFMHDVFRVSR